MNRTTDNRTAGLQEGKTTGRRDDRTTATPEQWWAGLKPVERRLAQQIALMIEEITESKRIEIRRERECIRARFIYLLKQPEKGCLSAIMLPECDRGAMN